MTKYTGNHKRLTSYKRGDTIPKFALRVVNQLSNEPIVPVSVCSQLRSEFDNLIHIFDVVIDADGTVTLGEIPTEFSKLFDAGEYFYDVQYTLADGRVVTYLQGSLKIEGDISRCP